MDTPGIFFSIALDLKSNKPEALVPTITTFPSKKVGSNDPSSSFQAGIEVRLLLSVG